jgi:hypothetical protein
MSDVYDEDGKYKPNLNGELDEDGDRLWTNSEGEYHREDGPAIEYADGDKYWYINGKYFSKDEWLQWLKSGQSSLDQKTILKLILENS